MSSNVTRMPPTATSAQDRAALTTPYIPPSNCTPYWEQTSLLWTQDGTFTYPVLISAPATSCYPSGWGSGEADSLFTFSPAVCPSGWDYWEMSHSDNSPEVSTAYCCERFHPRASYTSESKETNRAI
ncbi:hypothetical protein FNAPI_10865 [Fusarium napiforme]|uniref:Uncharacterized protein n=1 Tax=Fusarium napiforme TaxID=42672 RepID=A0A8H5IMB5_9HYPO|nr:hypothetical protein FNAPI_10865 [Fusarium napiforme]